MSKTARCELCGEPMPPGEEMFKFHGHSGPCPKPTRPVPDGGSLQPVSDERGRMVQIADLIKELQTIHNRWGNTCVYIRDLSWGSVALNRKADDDKRAAKLVSLEGSDPDDPDIYGH